MMTWKKSIRIMRGVLYVTLSNVPVKKKTQRDLKPYHGRMMYKMRLRHVNDIGFCPLCGKIVTDPDEVVERLGRYVDELETAVKVPEWAEKMMDGYGVTLQ